MIHYLWWIPSIMVLTCGWAWISKVINQNPKSWLFFLMFLPIPIWPFVAKISKNLLIDGLIYDFIVLLGYAGMFIYLGESKNFVLNQWIGLVLTLFGIVLMKVRFGG